MKYTDLDLNILQNNVYINYKDYKIAVKSYIPIAEKKALVDNVLSFSFDNGIYVPALIEMYLGVYLVMAYTDIDFSDDGGDTLAVFYDKFKSNGLIDAVINSIPDNEFEDLQTILEETQSAMEKYNGSIIGNASQILETLPQMTKKLNEDLKDFDADKYKEVFGLFKATNGKDDSAFTVIQ